MWLFGFLPAYMVAWQSECAFLLFDEGPLYICDEMNINQCVHVNGRELLCFGVFLLVWFIDSCL